MTRTDAHLELNAFRRREDCALVISGESLEVCLSYYEQEFMELATAAPSVVCCRCSPTQKAQVVSLLVEIAAFLLNKYKIFLFIRFSSYKNTLVREQLL